MDFARFKGKVVYAQAEVFGEVVNEFGHKWRRDNNGAVAAGLEGVGLVND